MSLCQFQFKATQFFKQSRYHFGSFLQLRKNYHKKTFLLSLNGKLKKNEELPKWFHICTNQIIQNIYGKELH